MDLPGTLAPDTPSPFGGRVEQELPSLAPPLQPAGTGHGPEAVAAREQLAARRRAGPGSGSRLALSNYALLLPGGASTHGNVQRDRWGRAKDYLARPAPYCKGGLWCHSPAASPAPSVCLAHRLGMLRNTCSFKPWCFGMGSWWSMLGVWLRNLSGNSNNIQLFDLHNQSGPGSGDACQQWPDRLCDGNVLMVLCMDGRPRLLPSLVSTCGKN